MATTNQTPSLPSTADPSPYLPVSWMAVAAATVSGFFVFTLVTLGLYTFFWENKPLVFPVLLFMPVLGILLSFAGRRMIRNSEGTRTGEKLVNTAWWASLLGGLSYFAYLLAINFSIHRDAENEVVKWVNYLTAVDPDDPGDKIRINYNKAFIMTIEPERRRGLLADDSAKLMGQFRDQYIAFRNMDIVRTAERNRGECSFEPTGMKDWRERGNGIDCIFTGTLKCPEGSFPAEFGLRRVEVPPSKTAEATAQTVSQWMFIIPPMGWFMQDKITRTPYGWEVAQLEKSGIDFGRKFFPAIAIEPGRNPYEPNNFPFAYYSMIGPEASIPFWDTVKDSLPARSALGGGPAGIAPFITTEYTNYFRDSFFKLPGGAEPSTEQKSKFKTAWDTLGLYPPGSRIRTSTDKIARLVLGERSIEVELPCELALPGSEILAAKCRLIVVCTEPGIVEEVKRLRSEAKSAQETSQMPADIASKAIHWRVLRVETDLVPVEPTRAPNQPPQPVHQQLPGAPQGS